MKINKDDFRKKVAEESGESKKVVDNVMESMFNVLDEELLSGKEKEAAFAPFGKFVTRRIAPARNRQVGNNLVDIDEQHYVSFKPYKKLKKKV